jgi:hypothetical protein
MAQPASDFYVGQAILPTENLAMGSPLWERFAPGAPLTFGAILLDLERLVLIDPLPGGHLSIDEERSGTL